MFIVIGLSFLGFFLRVILAGGTAMREFRIAREASDHATMSFRQLKEDNSKLSDDEVFERLYDHHRRVREARLQREARYEAGKSLRIEPAISPSA